MEGVLLIPDYDPVHGNRDSFLFRMYPRQCNEYAIDKPVYSQVLNFANTNATRAVVHGYGYFILCIGIKLGLFKELKQIVVMGGYVPENHVFLGRKEPITLEQFGLSVLFFFPSTGKHAPYALEGTDACKTSAHARVQVITGVKFGHEILEDKRFDPELANTLLVRLLRRVSDSPHVVEGVVFPETKVTRILSKDRMDEIEFNVREADPPFFQIYDVDPDEEELIKKEVEKRFFRFVTGNTSMETHTYDMMFEKKA
jgi:hypothetical protein